MSERNDVVLAFLYKLNIISIFECLVYYKFVYVSKQKIMYVNTGKSIEKQNNKFIQTLIRFKSTVCIDMAFSTV